MKDSTQYTWFTSEAISWPPQPLGMTVETLKKQVDLTFLFIHGVQFPEESVTCSFKLNLAFKLIFSWVPVEQQLEKERSSKKKGYNLSVVCLPELEKNASLLLFFLHSANTKSNSQVENLLADRTSWLRTNQNPQSLSRELTLRFIFQGYY